MQRIQIKVKDAGTETIRDTEVLGVKPTIRLMAEGDVYYFPVGWIEAVKTSTSLLRKEGYNVRTVRKANIDNKMYIGVMRFAD